MAGYTEMADTVKNDIATQLADENRYELALCDGEDDQEAMMTAALGKLISKQIRSQDRNYSDLATYYATAGQPLHNLIHTRKDQPVNVRPWREIDTEPCNQKHCGGHLNLVDHHGTSHCSTCRPLISEDLIQDYKQVQ